MLRRVTAGYRPYGETVQRQCCIFSPECEVEQQFPISIDGRRHVKMFRDIALIVLLVSLLPSCAGQFEGGTYKPMQQDFDRIRLDHLFVIAGLMQEYQKTTGHLPFANSADGKPVAVVIASEEQLKNDDGHVPIMLDLKTRAVDGKVPPKPERIETRTLSDLTQELKSVLKRDITLPVDPQRVPVNKPSVYLFTYYRDVYDVSAFLHNSFPFARKLGEYNYKVALSNRSNSNSGIWKPDELMQQKDFKEFFKTPFNRSGYKLQTVPSEK